MTLLEQTYEDMRTAMEAAGYRVTLESSKAQKDYWPRAIIAYYLYKCGWTNRDGWTNIHGWTNANIGKLIARHHSTVTSMRQRVQDALDLPAHYDDVTDIIANFKKQYHELFQRDL